MALGRRHPLPFYYLWIRLNRQFLQRQKWGLFGTPVEGFFFRNDEKYFSAVINRIVNFAEEKMHHLKIIELGSAQRRHLKPFRNGMCLALGFFFFFGNIYELCGVVCESAVWNWLMCSCRKLFFRMRLKLRFLLYFCAAEQELSQLNPFKVWNCIPAS